MLINKQTFYDTDILSSFLMVGEVNILQKLFDEIIIPKQVFDELNRKKTPNFVKNNLKALIRSGFVKIEYFDYASPIDVNFKCIHKGFWNKDLKWIGKGEAAAIACAIEYDAILASNNRSDVLYYVDRFDIPFLTASMILSIAVCNDIISKNHAEVVWKKMAGAGRYMPADSFSKYFSTMFLEEYEKFFKSKMK